jgi:hypothetical protein
MAPSLLVLPVAAAAIDMRSRCAAACADVPPTSARG